MTDAPERIWIEDERSEGGQIHVYERQPSYIDDMVAEYIRADIHTALQARLAEVEELVRDLKKMVKAAYCEGFRDGKEGGWIVGPENQPWEASDICKALKTMEEDK